MAFTLKSFETDSVPGTTTDALASSPNQSDLSDRYPWYTPSKQKIESGELDLFPETPSDSDLEKRYKRFQLARVIVNDVAEDTLRNGFFIKNLENPQDETQDEEFQKVYRNFIFSPFLKAIKFCRLFGYSILYLGYKDSKAPLNEAPPSTDPPASIGYLLPLKSNQVELHTSEYIPRTIDSISVAIGGEESRDIHPSRFLHLEHEGLGDDKKGMSALLPVYDLLTVQKHAEWSIGQDLWRGASGLLTLFAAEGATSSDAESALEAVENLHAKTRLVLPPGWEAEDLSPTRVAFDIQDAYEIIVQQVAAGTRIPSPILFPSSYGRRREEATQEYEGFLYSYQRSFVTPLLEKVFKKFQESRQLPEGPFEIVWRPISTSPYEEATANYMEAIQKKLEAEVGEKEIPKEEIPETTGAPTESVPPEQFEPPQEEVGEEISK